MFSAKRRKQLLLEMESKSFDVLIIGGGITGAGIALDAQARGMKTALIEMQDFAAGTSSRSTKLIHGGLRYLRQLEFKLVAEVGRERQIVYDNGPHVTTPVNMLLPIYDNGSLGMKSTNVGLKLYDFLAGVKKEEHRQMLTKNQSLKKEPLLKETGLQGSGLYVEYKTDDARLTVEVLKKAVTYGVKAVNYVKAEKLTYRHHKIDGVLVTDQIDGGTYLLKAQKIVNATGPWAQQFLKNEHMIANKQLHHTKGIHLVFDQKKFPLRQAVYFDAPDGRMIFAIPRQNKTYIGTTDTDYKGELSSPKVDQVDIDYLLHAISYQFPTVQLRQEDIESSWAGIRPLIHEQNKAPSEISRKDEIWVSTSGLITIAGGKLTGYRKMAEEVVDLLARQFKKEHYKIFSRSNTKHITISGGDTGGLHFDVFVKDKMALARNYGFSQADAKYLSKKYGSNVEKVVQYAKKRNLNGLPLMLGVQLLYSIDEEMAVSPADFFMRRTDYLYFHIDLVRKWKSRILFLMAEELNWSAEKMEKYERELDILLYEAALKKL